MRNIAVIMALATSALAVKVNLKQQGAADGYPEDADEDDPIYFQS